MKRRLRAEAALLVLGLGCSTARIPRPMGDGDVRQIAVASSHGPLELEYVTPLPAGPAQVTGILRVDHMRDDETLIFGGPGMAPLAVPRNELRRISVTRRGRGALIGAGVGAGVAALAGVALGFAKGASHCTRSDYPCIQKPALAALLAFYFGAYGGGIGGLAGLAIGGRDRFELAPP